MGPSSGGATGRAPAPSESEDIYPGPGNSFPHSLTNVNGTLFFTADNGTSGRELWRSNGTAAGTFLVRDIYPGISSARPAQLDERERHPVLHGPRWAIPARSCGSSDGTAAGTVLVKDINPGFFSSQSRTT